MAEQKTIVECKRTLLNDKNEREFSKGTRYEALSQCNVLRNVRVIDDLGDEHILGNWAKHFKNVTPGFVKNK